MASVLPGDHEFELKFEFTTTNAEFSMKYLADEVTELCLYACPVEDWGDDTQVVQASVHIIYLFLASLNKT